MPIDLNELEEKLNKISESDPLIPQIQRIYDEILEKDPDFMPSNKPEEIENSINSRFRSISPNVSDKQEVVRKILKDYAINVYLRNVEKNGIDQEEEKKLYFLLIRLGGGHSIEWIGNIKKEHFNKIDLQKFIYNNKEGLIKTALLYDIHDGSYDAFNDERVHFILRHCPDLKGLVKEKLLELSKEKFSVSSSQGMKTLDAESKIFPLPTSH